MKNIRDMGSEYSPCEQMMRLGLSFFKKAGNGRSRRNASTETLDVKHEINVINLKIAGDK